MKSEIQIIIKCKQPIKIEKPLQCLLKFSYRAGERNILQTVLSSFSFSFNFLYAFRSDNNGNTSERNVLGSVAKR